MTTLDDSCEPLTQPALIQARPGEIQMRLGNDPSHPIEDLYEYYSFSATIPFFPPLTLSRLLRLILPTPCHSYAFRRRLGQRGPLL